MIKTTRGGDHFDSSRYKYDTGMCSAKKGWAQIDSKQDASYYGQWCNPLTFKLFSYCEGDVTLIECDTEAEFISELRGNIAWNKERGYFIGIDAFSQSGEIRAALERMGFAEELH